MQAAKEDAGNDVSLFLGYFEEYVKSFVRDDPEMLRPGWKNK
jgi:hypothetical protein